MVGFVPGHGTTTEKQIYSFKDIPESQGQYSYRLKQIDYDGIFEYSDEIEIEYLKELNFILEQNYPNPFNPTTTIRYSMPETQLVTLTVYNSLGEAIINLVNEIKEAGIYEIEFDGTNLPSGIYLYTLSAGNFMQTKKLILLK